MVKKDSLGVISIGLLCITALVLWSQSEPVAGRFLTSAKAWKSIGDITGLIGLILYAISLILSSRIKKLEDFFGGINQVYAVHQVTGGLSFILLMVHPLLLAMQYLSFSVPTAVGSLLPGSEWAANVGIAALLVMMSLLIITYYLDFPYPLWKWTHKFMGLAFALGAIHAFFSPGDLSENPLLRQFTLGLVSLGVLAYVYRTLLGKYLIFRFTYVVDDIRVKQGDVIEILLFPKTRRVMKFVPGQFAFLTILGKHMNHEPHPFSISSPPVPQGIRLTVKKLGDFTSWLDHLTKGTPVLLEGPYGRFSYLFHPSDSYVWIGGGIGITPILSMAYTIPESSNVDVYYAVSDASEAVYDEELHKLSLANPHIRYIPWISKERGRVTGQAIQELSGDLSHKDFFICGPPAMMYSLKRQLISLGVPRKKILTEEFGML